MERFGPTGSRFPRKFRAPKAAPARTSHLSDWLSGSAVRSAALSRDLDVSAAGSGSPSGEHAERPRGG